MSLTATPTSVWTKSSMDEPDAPGFEPVRILEVEISQPIPALTARIAETGRTYRKALALVRLHSQPVGMVNVRLDGDTVTAEDFAQQIWRALGSEINAHLRDDGFPEATGLDVDGLLYVSTPPCLQAREAFLPRAPYLSVVIPTRDRPAQLEKCLNYLMASSYPRSRYELIVVDNAPKTSGTADLIDQMRLRDGGSSPLRYVREDYPGSGSARNRGFAMAQGEIVAFIDDDVRVDEHCLTELARGFDTTKQAGCVTGLVLPMELETPSQLWLEEWGGYSKGFTPRLFDLTEHRMDRPFYPYSPGIYGAGASMAFRKSVLSEIGGFDLALGNGTPALGGADIEILLRTVITGNVIAYAPASIMYHPHHRDYARLRKQMYGYGAGLSACLLRTVVENPRLLPDFARKLPAGLFFTLNPRSAHHARKAHDYPSELTVLEFKGMLYGPIGYIRSRRQLAMRRHERRPADRAKKRALAGTAETGAARKA